MNTELNFEISTYLSQRQALIEKELEKAIPIKYPEILYQSIRYSLLDLLRNLK